MSDFSLRELERRFRESQTNESLNNYNAARRRAGLPLIRAENYLIDWMQSLHEYFDIDDDEHDWDTHNYSVHSMDIINDDVVVDGMQIHFEASLRSNTRLSINYTIDGAMVSLRLDAIVNEEAVHDEEFGTEVLEQDHILRTRSDTAHVISNGHDVSIMHDDREAANNFLDAIEMFNVGLKQAAKIFSDYIKAFETVFDNDKRVHIHLLRRYLTVGISAFPEFSKTKNWKRLMRKLEKIQWSRDIFYDFAKTLEDYVEGAGLYFDNEGGWPASVQYGALVLGPGYCDSVAEELDEGQEPDSNTRGGRGYAYDIGDTLGELLNDYDRDNDLEDETDGWVGDYELEEYYVEEGDDPDEGELCFKLPVSRELTPEYLLYIFTD